jgi:hypothetical protein
VREIKRERKIEREKEKKTERKRERAGQKYSSPLSCIQIRFASQIVNPTVREMLMLSSEAAK